MVWTTHENFLRYVNVIICCKIYFVFIYFCSSHKPRKFYTTKISGSMVCHYISWSWKILAEWNFSIIVWPSQKFFDTVDIILCKFWETVACSCFKSVHKVIKSTSVILFAFVFEHNRLLTFSFSCFDCISSPFLIVSIVFHLLFLRYRSHSAYVSAVYELSDLIVERIL